MACRPLAWSYLYKAGDSQITHRKDRMQSFCLHRLPADASEVYWRLVLQTQWR